MPWKLELARKLGATDVRERGGRRPVAAVRELTGGGVETAFECIGTAPTCQQAVAMMCRGGTAVMVGVVPIGVMVGIPMLDVVLSGKKVIGSMMGDNRFRIDMPRYVRLLPRRAAAPRRDDLGADPARRGERRLREDEGGRGGAHP